MPMPNRSVKLYTGPNNIQIQIYDANLKPEECVEAKAESCNNKWMKIRQRNGINEQEWAQHCFVRFQSPSSHTKGFIRDEENSCQEDN